MYAWVTCRQIAPGCGHSCPLCVLRRGQFNHRSDAVAIAFMSSQPKRDPVITGDGFIVEDMSGASIGADDSVDAAIIVDVADRHATPHPGLLKHFTGSK